MTGDTANKSRTNRASAAITATLPRIVQPLQEFLNTEAAGGVLLLAATVAALVWVNAPFGGTYEDFWGTHLSIDLDVIHLDESIRTWVNDALMAVFFFVVGLEIKRELLRGELAERRKAALPVAAALGGMVAPALIFLAFNAGGDGRDGWGIPMATDIAFAVGVMALLGSRVPLSLKVFLLALAIVDDIGAIVIIALFYSNGIAVGWLAGAVGLFVLIAVMNRAGVRHLGLYVVVGVAAWLAVHESGVHATIAGVVLGLMTPSAPPYDQDRVEETALGYIGEFQTARIDDTREGEERTRTALRALEDLSRHSRSPLDRLEHDLHPWTSYAVIPIFALANAGVALGGGIISDAMRSPVTLGVALGLVAGKPLGILLFSWLAVRFGAAALPGDASWTQIAGVAIVAGIGFTVSLFISGLAFSDPQLVDEAKIGILAGSAVMGAAGYLLLRMKFRASAQTSEAAVAALSGSAPSSSASES
jgi:NhaA family Na+:H+ antiporter